MSQDTHVTTRKACLLPFVWLLICGAIETLNYLLTYLPFQPQGITASWPVPIAMLHCLVTEARVCEQLAQGVVTWKWNGRDSNPRPFESQVQRTNHYTTRPVTAALLRHIECGLLLHASWRRVVCPRAYERAVPKRMNRSICRLVDRIALAQETAHVRPGCSMAPPGDYDWTICLVAAMPTFATFTVATFA